jgi:endoglucanase
MCSYLNSQDKLDIEANIVSFADEIRTALDGEGYPTNLQFTGQYPWGSNSFVVNRAIALAYAYEITGNTSYQDYILRTMDYIMGVNAMDLSYVTVSCAKCIVSYQVTSYFTHIRFFHIQGVRRKG